MQNKVLHVTQFLSPGGLERMIWGLSEELIYQGHISEVFIYDREGEKTLLSEFKVSCIKTHFHPKKRGFSFATVKKLRELIKSKKYTAVHSHDLGALIYLSLANLGLNIVTHVHTQHSFIHFKKSWIYPFYERFFCKFPNSITVVSPHQIDEYAKLGISARAIANGIFYPHENPFKQPIKEFRESIITHSNFEQKGLFGPMPRLDSKWILVPGRIQKSKGQNLLFQIMKRLNTEEIAQVHFIIIGAPTFETDRILLNDLYNSHPEFQSSISYLGFHANPLEWMIASNGVVLLSEFEGFPLVPLESIGLGIPTLLSDITPHLFLKDKATLTSLNQLESAINWVKERIKTSLKSSEEEKNREWIKNAPFRVTYSIKRLTYEFISLYEKENDRRNFQFKSD